MKMSAGLMAAVVFLFAATAWALTPDDITMYKDSNGKQLRIVVRKPTRLPRKEYIKRITVTIDDQKPVEERFYFQRGSAQRMSVPVDNLDTILTIKVIAEPTTGGSVERMFTPQGIMAEKPTTDAIQEEASY
jgi:hypothetical protein